MGALLEYGGWRDSDAAAMVSSGGKEGSPTSSGGSDKVAACMGGRVVALWALKRLSARAVRSSSVKSEKLVVAA